MSMVTPQRMISKIIPTRCSGIVVLVGALVWFMSLINYVWELYQVPLPTTHPHTMVPEVELLQEYLYPPFTINYPNLMDDNDRRVFQTGTCHGFLETYNTSDKLYGKIMLIRNGVFRLPYDCGYLSDLKPLIDPHPQAYRNLIHHKKLIIMVIPDGWSFQHFLDGTLPKLIQALPLIRTRKIKILLDREPRDKIVFEILERLGFNIERDIVYSRRDVIQADELYSTCWTPPLHPILWQLSQQLLGVYPIPSSPDMFALRNSSVATTLSHLPTTLPVEDDVEQVKVIFLNRNPKNSFNKGRMILNQEAVVSYLRGRYGVNFIDYDSKTAGGLKGTINIFRQARVVIGVHGGGMYNIQFARQGAHVLEIVPVHGFDTTSIRYVLPRCMVFVIANLVRQNYWHVAMQTQRHNGDLNVNVKKLAQTLDLIDKQQIYHSFIQETALAHNEIFL